MSSWETGKSLPNAVTLKRIADCFDVSVDYIYTEHDDSISKEQEEKDQAERQDICSLVISSLVIRRHMVTGK